MSHYYHIKKKSIIYFPCLGHRLRVLHNKHFESTLLSSHIRPILFEFRDLQYIQYNMELHYILKLAKTRKTTLES